MEPGYEDLSLISYLRLGLGARAVVAYATYGSGTPGDAEGGTPLQIVGERREESFQAARHLGASAHFLNLQDPGILPSRAAIEAMWGHDTAVARIDRMLRYYRPDVVILGGDFRGDTVRSLRVEALREILLDAIALAGDSKSRPDTLRPGPWKVPRLYVEAKRDTRVVNSRYDQVHPVWGKSYRAIAIEASRAYRSLRLHQAAWSWLGERSYAMILPTTGRAPVELLENLPALTRKLRPLATSIVKLSSRGKPGARGPRLAETVAAIDSVDLYLSRHRKGLTADELRLLAGWKNSLEELRCSLLDLRVEYALSESLVTTRQLIYLKFGGVSAATPVSKTRILFPGAVDRSWGINESPEYSFPFAPPQEFRIITPEALDQVIPPAQTGIFQSSPRTRFSFLLMHMDSIHQHEFYYRADILLRAGPRRTFEILTPIVRSGDSARVVFRMLNLSRDKYEGTVSITDSLFYPAAKKVRLSGKDEGLTDTLVFFPRLPPPVGDYPLTLTLSGGTPLRFAIRSFEAAVGPGRLAAVISPTDNSPLMQGLTRLGVGWKRVDPASLTLPDGGLIVLDRDAAALQSVREAMPEILAWVRSGGRLVVFPQMLVPAGEGPVLPGAMFRAAPQLQPLAPLDIDTTDSLFRSPNRIGAGDWEGWVISRSLCSIVLPADAQARIPIRSAEGRDPLLVQLPFGKGSVTVVALDLVSQISNVHPGAHRLLANILAQ
jgi:LmbE family N-acetylglucosaminyl deacetylase